MQFADQLDLVLLCESDRIGDYEVTIDSDSQAIFPELANGERARVVHANAYIFLRHLKSNDIVTFRITKRGNVHDSREPKRLLTMDELRAELDRMLGPEMGKVIAKKASDELNTAKMGLGLSKANPARKARVRTAERDFDADDELLSGFGDDLVL